MSRTCCNVIVTSSRIADLHYIIRIGTSRYEFTVMAFEVLFYKLLTLMSNIEIYVVSLQPLVSVFLLWNIVVAQNDCKPKDCRDLKCYRVSKSKDGPHTIFPGRPDLTSLQVSCDQETEYGGWIIFQRRVDGSVNYRNGFGRRNCGWETKKSTNCYRAMELLIVNLG